ncbi:MAG: Beta-1,4-mannooligosaccharide phosphorylase [Candidatus Marinimicrobia bacterium ADurb.Bin030]|nr:MAG: Beta-1,4-mannooligosaccharide phosphorylase [Candidatus Marinimicrobia bacterium ADurb.Bin030]
MILDIDEPSKVLYRTRDYLLTPEKPYETTGFVPNVVFPCANLCDTATGRIAIYYGAADTYTALAFAQTDELIDYIKNNSEV